MRNIVRGKHLNLAWHRPPGRRKIRLLHRKIEVCFPISQLPQLDKLPIFHFFEWPTLALSIHNTTDLWDFAPMTQAWERGSYILPAQFQTRWADTYRADTLILPWSQRATQKSCVRTQKWTVKWFSNHVHYWTASQSQLLPLHSTLIQIDMLPNRFTGTNISASRKWRHMSPHIL